MKRVLLALVAGTLMVQGCATLRSLNPFADPVKPHQDTLPPRDWARIKIDNNARLAGEGIGEKKAAPKSASMGRTIDELADFLEFAFWGLPKRLIEYGLLGQTPGYYAAMMEDPNSADARRTGVLQMVSRYHFARVGIYTKRYSQIAQSDSDYLVRAAAIRALNRSRDRTSVSVYVRAMDDPHMIVRLEAAKAMANVPDRSAIPALLKHMDGTVDIRGDGGRMERISENRDVRLACADALRNFPENEVARALVEVLRDREFEVSYQARKSLILLTGRDFRYDQTKWREYLAATKTPFGNG